MQLVRNILVPARVNDTSLTDGRSASKAINDATYPDLDRKLKEMKYAIGLEKKYSKDDDPRRRTSTSSAWAATPTASRPAREQYFNTTADKLTPAQAASLIAIVQNPNAQRAQRSRQLPAQPDAPRRHPRLDVHRGHIDKAQYDEAIATKVDEKFVHADRADATAACRPPPRYRFACDDAYNSIQNGNVPALGADQGRAARELERGRLQVRR